MADTRLPNWELSLFGIGRQYAATRGTSFDAYASDRNPNMAKSNDDLYFELGKFINDSDDRQVKGVNGRVQDVQDKTGNGYVNYLNQNNGVNYLSEPEEGEPRIQKGLNQAKFNSDVDDANFRRDMEEHPFRTAAKTLGKGAAELGWGLGQWLIPGAPSVTALLNGEGIGRAIDDGITQVFPPYMLAKPAYDYAMEKADADSENAYRDAENRLAEEYPELFQDYKQQERVEDPSLIEKYAPYLLFPIALFAGKKALTPVYNKFVKPMLGKGAKKLGDTVRKKAADARFNYMADNHMILPEHPSTERNRQIEKYAEMVRRYGPAYGNNYNLSKLQSLGISGTAAAGLLGMGGDALRRNFPAPYEIYQYNNGDAEFYDPEQDRWVPYSDSAYAATAGEDALERLRREVEATRMWKPGMSAR